MQAIQRNAKQAQHDQNAMESSKPWTSNDGVWSHRWEVSGRLGRSEPARLSKALGAALRLTRIEHNRSLQTACVPFHAAAATHSVAR